MNSSAAIRHILLRVIREIPAGRIDPEIIKEVSNSIAINASDEAFLIKWTIRGEARSKEFPQSCFLLYQRGDRGKDPPVADESVLSHNRAGAIRIICEIFGDPGLMIRTRSSTPDLKDRPKPWIGFIPIMLFSLFIVKGMDFPALPLIILLLFTERYYYRRLWLAVLALAVLPWIGAPFTAFISAFGMAIMAAVSPRHEGRKLVFAAAAAVLISTFTAWASYDSFGIAVPYPYRLLIIIACVPAIFFAGAGGVNYFLIPLTLPLAGLGMYLDGEILAGVCAAMTIFIYDDPYCFRPAANGNAAGGAEKKAAAFPRKYYETALLAAGAFFDSLAERKKAAFLCAAFFFGVSFLIFLFIGIQKTTFNYTFDSFDDWILYGAVRLADGLPVYLDPSVQHPVIDIYPPGIFLVLAPLILAFGPSFTAARAAVFIAVLISGLLIFIVIKKHWSNACYPIVFTLMAFSTFFTLSGQTVLFLAPSAFVLLAMMVMLYVLERTEETGGYGHIAILALVQFCAFYFKQPTVFFGLAVFFYYLLKRKFVYAFLFGGLCALLLSVSFLMGNLMSGGMWYLYMIDLPRRHAFDLSKIAHLKTQFMTGAPLLILLLSLLFIQFKKEPKKLISPQLVFLCSIFPFSFASYIHVGGGLNQFIESGALTVMLIGIITGEVARGRDAAGRRRRAAVLLVFLIAGVSSLYLMRPDYPRRDARESGRRISETVRALKPRNALAHGTTSFIFRNSSADFINTGVMTNFYDTGAYDTDVIKEKADTGFYDIILLQSDRNKIPFLQDALRNRYRLYKSYPYTNRNIELYLENRME